jgi:hypothetical protein
MDVPAGDGNGFWWVFLMLPSFIIAIFFACLGTKDAFIKLSDCQQCPGYQVDIELDYIKTSSGSSPFDGRDHVPPLMLYQDTMNLGNEPWSLGTQNKIEL